MLLGFQLVDSRGWGTQELHIIDRLLRVTAVRVFCRFSVYRRPQHKKRLRPPCDIDLFWRALEAGTCLRRCKNAFI
jgi:hypothetical protein